MGYSFIFNFSCRLYEKKLFFIFSVICDILKLINLINELE